MKLSNKTALVTGGSRGIGRAIAIAFAEEGANVAINYNNDNLAATKTVNEIENLGVRSNAFHANTSSASQVHEMIDNVLKEFGVIDILVNNAGIIRRKPFLEISEEEWDLVLGVNLKGYFLCSQYVARHMVDRRQGKIINIASVSQIQAGLNVTAYSVSKAGVAMLTKQMALELAPYKINVNGIAPGLTETDLNRKDLADPEYRNRRLSRIPMAVILRPEDIAGTAVFLASDNSRFVTGATIFVDAGTTVG
jgi:NAD(P)-dependent dehydrogenase (short-subunit alcohol dehydrogenase family)